MKQTELKLIRKCPTYLHFTPKFCFQCPHENIITSNNNII